VDIYQELTFKIQTTIKGEINNSLPAIYSEKDPKPLLALVD